MFLRGNFDEAIEKLKAVQDLSFSSLGVRGIKVFGFSSYYYYLFWGLLHVTCDFLFFICGLSCCNGGSCWTLLRTRAGKSPQKISLLYLVLSF